MVNKMHAFVVFSENYLRPYQWSSTNFTAVVNDLNPKTETESEIFEREIVKAQTYFAIKQLHFFL